MIIRPENFTHLHIHSCHSIKDGCIPVSKIVDLQVEHGARAAAITDHGAMTGGWFLYDHIHNVKKYDGIKHIIGLEAYVSLTRDELNDYLANPKAIEDKAIRKETRTRLAKKYHQILLAKNKTGYYNLVKIHNDAWENGFYYSPATTKDVIFANSEGLIATSTCLASIWCQYILDGKLAKAEKELMEWKEVFGDNFYVELQPTNYDVQKLVNIELIKLAQKTNTKMVITNDVHYVGENDHEFHTLLLNLDKIGKEDDKSKLWEFSVDDLFLKTLDQMKMGWKEKHKGKEFSESIFEECVWTISDIVDQIEHYTLESKPLLPAVSDKTPVTELQERVVKCFKEKIKSGVIPRDKIEEYQNRLITELETIVALNSENYFLVCNEITNFCHENNIGVGLGRGSAASSLVLYLLGVTGVDPVKHKLLFQRFLNKNRRQKLVM